MAKKSKKLNVVKDVKKAAANDKTETTQAKMIRWSGVQKGIHFHRLAGSPTRHAVLACFGKRGYAMSWIERAEKMNTTPEALTARFKAEPQEVKVDWELAHPIVVKAPKDKIAKGVTVTSTRKVVDPLATVTPVAE
jgi:hypothetical protein